MSSVVLVLTVLAAAPALVLGLGGAREIDAQPAGAPRRLRHVVDDAAVLSLRFGLLLALLLLGAVAIVGSSAAIYGQVRLPSGVVVACVGSLVLSAIVLLTFGRPGRRRVRRNGPASR